MPTDLETERPYVIHPVLAYILLCAATGTAESFFPNFGIIPTVMLFAGLSLWSAVTIARVVLAGLRGQWRKASLRLLLLVILWPSGGFLIFVAGDYLHLLLCSPIYAKEIIKSPNQLLSFPWQGEGFVGSYNADRTLDYIPDLVDGSDASSKCHDGYSVSSRHLIWRFYLVTGAFGLEPCP